MSSRRSRRDEHDGRMDPTGSGQNQSNPQTLPRTKKRRKSRSRRSAPRRFVDTERNFESNRPSTQQDERGTQQSATNPSASQSTHLPTLVGTAIRTRDNSSPVRRFASSPNRLVLPPIENRGENRPVPTPHPPQQTPGSSRGRRSSRNMNSRDGRQSGQSGRGSGRRSRPYSGDRIYRVTFPDSPEGYPPLYGPDGPMAMQEASPVALTVLSPAVPVVVSPEVPAVASPVAPAVASPEVSAVPSPATSTMASRTANSADRGSDRSRLDNVSRISGMQGSTSARTSSRNNTTSKTSVQTSSRQPVAPSGTYQHQGSNSDGALIIKGIKKPTAPSGKVCNSNTLRRHSTGGKIVPPQEKDNKGLIVIDKGFLKPTPPKKPKSDSKTSQYRASKTFVKSKRSPNLESNISLKTKRSSNQPKKTLEVETKIQDTKRSSKPQSKTTSSKAKRPSKDQSKTLQVEQEVEESKVPSKPQSNTSLKSKRSSNHQNLQVEDEVEVEYENDFEALSEEDIEPASNSRAASPRSVSPPPSSIPEEIEGDDGRYDYTDETFEVDEDDEQPLTGSRAGSRADSEASIPEELPGQSRPRSDYNDDEARPESEIPEDIVTSDDHDDDDEDDGDVSPTSRF